MSALFGDTLKGNNTFSASVLVASSVSNPSYVVGEAYEPTSNWILKTGTWNDTGLWEDIAVWID